MQRDFKLVMERPFLFGYCVLIRTETFSFSSAFVAAGRWIDESVYFVNHFTFYLFTILSKNNFKNTLSTPPHVIYTKNVLTLLIPT